MYVPNHLKWRILLAQELKLHYFERENSHRNCKRIFELYGRYLLGTTYDTFLNYLNQLKYEIGSLRLPPYIEAAIGLLEPLRIASERLRIRKTNGTWTLLEVVEETMRILQERSQPADHAFRPIEWPRTGGLHLPAERNRPGIKPPERDALARSRIDEESKATLGKAVGRNRIKPSPCNQTAPSVRNGQPHRPTEGMPRLSSRDALYRHTKKPLSRKTEVSIAVRPPQRREIHRAERRGFEPLKPF